MRAKVDRNAIINDNCTMICVKRVQKKERMRRKMFKHYEFSISENKASIKRSIVLHYVIQLLAFVTEAQTKIIIEH